MEMKNKIISIATVIILLVAVLVVYKSGKLDLFSKSSSGPVTRTDKSDNASQKSGTQEHEKQTYDKMMLLHKGEEGLYENLVTDSKGTITESSLRYRFKFLDYSISKKKPEGMTMNFYKKGEEQVDADGTFIDDTYYVTVTYEATNLQEEGWRNDGFYPQALSLGRYDENGFTRNAEARKYVLVNAPEIGGHTYIKKGETAIITSCYCVKKEVISMSNIAVEASVRGQNTSITMPYFVLELGEVIE